MLEKTKAMPKAHQFAMADVSLNAFLLDITMNENRCAMGKYSSPHTVTLPNGVVYFPDPDANKY